MAGIHFDITGENRNFLQSLRGAENGVRQTANAMEQYGQQIEGMFNKIKTAAELSLAGFTVKGFAEKVALVRGEFQQLEVAFETMLGSTDKARAMMDDMTKLAATTPFDLQGVANGAKQLLAYGMEADKITDTLRRLGDVAAGLGIQLGDLTYLYGTTMAQGRLYTQDLNQFTGRGIPMIRELAKQFGVAESEVKDLVTAGKVGFPEVEKVIQSLTDKGGQFGGLMEAQSHTIVGQISNIEDSIDMMFNEMGKSSEGAINTVLDGVGFAIDHYKEFGSVILGVVASYGEWKAAAMIVNSWHNMVLNQAKEIEETRRSELSALADKFKDTDDTAQTQANTVATEQNTIARNANKSAIDAEIAALEEALKVKLAEAEANYNSATSKAAEAALAVDEANEKVSALEEEYEAILKTGNVEKIESAEMELNTAVAEANGAQKNLLAAREEVATASTVKNTAATKLNTLQTEVDTIQKKANTTATGIWAAVTKTATTAVRGLTAAIAANPIGALLVGITTALSLIPMFSSETEEASAEVTRFGEAAVKQTNNVETLLSVIESTSDTSKVHKDSVDELIKIYDEYGVSIDNEQDQLQQLIDKHDELIKKIREEGEERQKANLLQSYEEGMTKAQEEMQQAWSNAYKNAEYDGSGLFDDWDANDFRDKADQISLVANAITQGEFEKLQQIVEDGGTVTQEQINETIQRVKERVEQESQKLSGASLYTSSYDEAGNEIKHYIDIDYDGIIENYADKVLNLASARRELVEEIKNTKKATDDEAESVDYSSMSFSDLIDKAYGAKDAVESVGNTDGTPTIDTKPADDATSAFEGTQGALNTLNSMTATPFVNTQYINNALMQTGNLINSLNTLGQSPLFSGTGVKMPKFNLNTSGFGLNVGGPKLGFNTNFNFGSSMYGYNPIATDPAAQARAELMNRVNNARSDSKVDALLKEVNDALKDATYGSNERAELAKLQKTLQDRKKKNSTSSSSKSGKKGSSGKTTAEKVADEQERLDDMTDDIALQRIRKEQDLANRLIDVRLEAEGNSALILAKKRQQENKEEILQIERERDDAMKAYVDAERKIFEQKEKIKKTQNSKYKEQKFDESSVDTSAIAAQYNEIIELTQKKQAQDLAKEQSDALTAYLAEYGTFEQRKLAITQQYEEKIKAATTKGDRLTLQEQLKSALSAIDTEVLRRNIDWADIFGDMGGMLYDEMRSNLEQLDEYMRSSEFLSLGATDQKNISDIASQMRAKVGGGTADFSKLGEQMNTLQTKMQELQAAQEAEKKAVELVREKQDAYNKAVADGVEDLSTYKAELNLAKEAQNQCSEKVKELSASSEQAARDLHNNLGSVVNGLNNLSSGLQGLKSGSLQGAFEGLKTTCSSLSTLISGKVGSALGALAGKMGGLIGQIVESALGLLDVLKDGISSFITSLLDTVLNAVNGILHDVLSGKIVTNVIGSVVNGITNIFDTLSFGALSGWMGGNVDKNEKEIAKLSESNEMLCQSIEGLTETIKSSDNTNTQSVEAYKKAMAAQEEWEQNQRNAIKLRASEYSNSGHGFLGLGGKHSFNYHLNDKGSGWYGWNDFTNALQQNGVNKSVRSAGDIWNLSPEEMKLLRDFAPTAWMELLRTDGESNPSDLINAYIEKAGVGDQLLSQLNEKLTGYSWDGFKDSFASALSDMGSTTEDFADNIEKVISQAILNSLITSQYQDRIKALYKMIADAAEDDNITKEEADKIRAENEAIANSMIADRERLIELGILNNDGSAYKQEASTGSWQNLGEETAQELNGRFTAVQMNTADMADRMLTTLTLLTGITETQASNALILGEIRNMMVYTNSYLEDVVKYAKMTYNQFGTKLDDIVKNTKNM